MIRDWWIAVVAMLLVVFSVFLMVKGATENAQWMLIAALSFTLAGVSREVSALKREAINAAKRRHPSSGKDLP